MFNIAVTAQIIAALICLSAVIIIGYQKTSSYSNIIIITFVCSFVQNGAYILELTANDVSQGMAAVKAEYLGGAFEIGLLMIFMFRYCGHDFAPIVKVLLVLEGIIVLFGVWTWEYTRAYYKNVEFIQDPVIPHLSMDHGWLYYIFAIVTVLELIASIFILTVSILKTNQQHMKTNYYILLIVVIVPFVLFITSITGVLGGFDATPMGVAIAVGTFATAIARKHVFDLADAAGENILANLDSAIIIINNENGYEYSNNRAKQLYPSLKNYNRGDILRDVEIKNLLDTTRGKTVTIDDRIFDISRNKVVVNKETVGTTLILFDTTDSILQLEKMKELRDTAEEANRAKSAFLASVTHEIRTPINVVMGLSEVLLRDFATKETEDYYQNIRSSSNTLSSLINDIIDYSKIESGNLDIVSNRFDMSKVLSELVNIYEFRCNQKELEFIYDISRDIPKYLIGDELRIRQIATNLLSNAVKYTNKGTVKFRLSFKNRSDYAIDLIMAVEDTGTGISRDNYDKLFTGFSRIESKDTKADVGTGLGLTITNQLVEMMGGILNFKSEVGKGTVFSVIIPLIAATDSLETIGEISATKRAKNFHAYFTAPNAEILAVDDSKINLKVFNELIKEINPKVTFASSGEECLELVRQRHFDMIFMDHRMPGMDGVETSSRIKQTDNECHTTPIIMVTANSSNGDREWYLSKGFIDFIAKPFSSEQLATMLYKYLPEDLIDMN